MDQQGVFWRMRLSFKLFLGDNFLSPAGRTYFDYVNVKMWLVIVLSPSAARLVGKRLMDGQTWIGRIDAVWTEQPTGPGTKTATRKWVIYYKHYAMVTAMIRLRFDGRSTPFDCLSKVIKVIVTYVSR